MSPLALSRVKTSLRMKHMPNRGYQPRFGPGLSPSEPLCQRVDLVSTLLQFWLFLDFACPMNEKQAQLTHCQLSLFVLFRTDTDVFQRPLLLRRVEPDIVDEYLIPVLVSQ
jgi:hypothetical protein